VVPHRGHKPAPFAIYGVAWLGYAVGAAAGAAAFAALRWPLVIPAAGLAAIYWLARRAGKLSTSGL